MGVNLANPNPIRASGEGRFSVAKHGLLCFCSKCTRTSLFGSGQTPKKKGKGSGSKPVSLGGSSSSFPTRDTGGTPAKRHTNKSHGTNRRGGRQS